MSKRIENFKKTQDYIDICYMIEHVKENEVRLDVLQVLGYKVGIDIVKEDKGVKNIYIGKRNELRMQVTPKFKHVNLAQCVIIESK
jgi:hypothetical protein